MLQRMLDSVSFREKIKFFSYSVKNPRMTGSQLPTGRFLSNAMAEVAGVTLEDSRSGVVELGPGTGSVTRALMANGFRADRICSVELSREFANYCRLKYPEIKLIEASALEFEKWREDLPFREVSSVVSSLPLMLFDMEQRKKLICGMLKSWEDGGLGAERVIQFSYFGREPLPYLNGEGIVVERERFVLMNVYPASVWSYSLE